MQIHNFKNKFLIRSIGENLSSKLGWQDLNLRVAESKSAALPLGDTPK
jgi:hypothetical protein